jgi:hypothetical protein
LTTSLQIFEVSIASLKSIQTTREFQCLSAMSRELLKTKSCIKAREVWEEGNKIRGKYYLHTAQTSSSDAFSFWHSNLAIS